MAKETVKQDFEDPAAPFSNLEVLGDLNAARELANYGEEGIQAFDQVSPFAPPTLPIDWAKVLAFLNDCENCDPRVGYGPCRLPRDGNYS